MFDAPPPVAGFRAEGRAGLLADRDRRHPALGPVGLTPHTFGSFFFLCPVALKSFPPYPQLNARSPFPPLWRVHFFLPRERLVCIF